MFNLVRGMFATESGPVLEIGSYVEESQDHLNMRGAFRPGTPYVGVDFNAGAGVDRVVDLLDPVAMGALVDEVRPRITLCLYVVEHVWRIHDAMHALSAIWHRNPESWLVIATHQNQPFHGTDKYGDYWRVTLPGLAALARDAGIPGARVYGLHDTSNPEDVVAVRQPQSMWRPWPDDTRVDFLKNWQRYDGA